MNKSGFLNYIYDNYKALSLNEVSLLFEGQVTHQVMKALTTLVEEQLEELNESERTQRRVYHVLVESLQNINRHAGDFQDEAHSHAGRGVLLVDKQDDAYNVTTGNIIANTQIEDLAEFFGKINNYDSEALDDIYKQQLREGQLSPKGGAGLGFIDIRRKTGHPLEYQFVPVDENTSFFIFTSKISR